MSKSKVGHQTEKNKTKQLERIVKVAGKVKRKQKGGKPKKTERRFKRRHNKRDYRRANKTTCLL